MAEEALQNNSDSQTQDSDMNKFEHQKGYSRGCREGYHDFNQSKTELKVEGDKTMIVMECIMCGTKVSKLADLNINDLIQNYDSLGDPKPPQTFEKPNQEVKGFDSDEFWNKLRGR